jgi:hypothetical protein
VIPTEATKKHVIERYVTPARQSGAETVHVRVGNVLKELGWTNRTPSVFSTLSSRAFQREAGLEFIEKRGGPPSGGPSTTVEFVYRLLDAEASSRSRGSDEKPIPDGAGLEKLFGIFRDVYASFGGGEAYLKAERNWGPDIWERYEREERARKRNRE